MDYVLGVDGGATETTVLIVDLSGGVVVGARSGPSNYRSVGQKLARGNITKSVLRAVGKLDNSEKFTFRSACFGMAGNNIDTDEKIFKSIIFNDEIKPYLNTPKTFICNDTRIGLEAGSDNKNKMIIICGTGSNCFGMNEEGKEAKANGWDYILGDEGSGYEIGRKALKATMKAYDGRGDNTLLIKTILAELKLKNISQLIEWAYGRGNRKHKVATIAKVVCQTAENSDGVSIRILEEEAFEALLSIKSVAKRLNITNKNFDLVLAGGLFKCKKYFKDVLINKVMEEFPKANFKSLTKKPVEGAIKLAVMNI